MLVCMKQNPRVVYALKSLDKDAGLVTLNLKSYPADDSSFAETAVVRYDDLIDLFDEIIYTVGAGGTMKIDVLPLSENADVREHVQGA